MKTITEKEFKVTIRRAAPSDSELLSELGRRCFHEAFNEVTAPHDMQDYLDSTFQQSRIEKQLTDAHSFIFIAEADAQPAGYVYFHPAAAPQGIEDKAAVKLERIYLRKPYYGAGVGDALMQTCIEQSRRRGYQTIWLSSWESNDRANAFYKKWGFKVVGRQEFIVGSDVQNDFILSRAISFSSNYCCMG